MGYPLEESPFAEMVRRKLRRMRGEDHDLSKDHATGRTDMVPVPGEPPITTVNQMVEELDYAVMEAARGDCGMRRLEALVKLAAFAQRAAEDMDLIGRD